MPQAPASSPLFYTEIQSLTQTQDNQGKNSDRKLSHTGSLVSFEWDPVFLLSAGQEGMGKRAAGPRAHTSLWHSYFLALILRLSTNSLPKGAGSAQSPRAPLLPALASGSEMAPLVAVPRISSPKLVLSANRTDKDSQGSGQSWAQLFENTETPKYLFQAGTLPCFPRWKGAVLYKALSISMGFHRRTKANDAIFPA